MVKETRRVSVCFFLLNKTDIQHYSVAMSGTQAATL